MKSLNLLKTFFSISNWKVLLGLGMFLTSIAGNGVQCGYNTVKKYQLKRARMALDVAVAQKKAMEIKIEQEKYKVVKNISDEEVAKRKKRYKELEEKARKAYEELARLKKKINDMSLSGVANEFKKEGY